MEDIDHSKTKANYPQTNGICEPFHKTMKNEFYDIAFRKKIYISLEELQIDVDQWTAAFWKGLLWKNTYANLHKSKAFSNRKEYSCY